MSDQTGDLEFLGRQHLQRRVEAEEKVVVDVLVEDADEALPEHGGSEAVRQDHVAPGRVGQPLHLEQADLIEAAGEDVDGMSVVGHPFGEVVVELTPIWAVSAAPSKQVRSIRGHHSSHLHGLLEVFDVVPVDVVMRAHRLTQLGADDHARSFGGRPAREQHDPAARVLVRRFHQTHGDAEGDTGAPERTLVARRRPWILLELLQRIRQLKLALLNR